MPQFQSPEIYDFDWIHEKYLHHLFSHAQSEHIM